MSILPENTYQNIIGKDIHEVGLDALCGIAPRGGVVQDVISGGATAYAYGQAPTTGFTSPSDVVRNLDALNLSVSALNKDFLANVHRDLVLQAWTAWRNNWTKFYTDSESFLGTTWLSASRRNEQTEVLRQELDRWYTTYAAEAPNSPATLASPSAPLPKSQAQVDRDKPPSEPFIPWWVWVVGTGGVALLGYVGYQVFQEAKSIRREVLPHLIPLATHVASRDQL